jgi:cell division septation protein DedD
LRTGPVSITALALVLLSGCGTTEHVENQPQQQPATSESNPPRAMQLESKTDTVNAVHGMSQPAENSALREPQIKFMVQIGAFKNPVNASAVQILARERYHLPVLNDYNIKSGLYQIRIGFFESKDSAYAFRRQMQGDHPEAYLDSWVVQLKR